MQISRNAVNGPKNIIRFWWESGLSSASSNHLTMDVGKIFSREGAVRDFPKIFSRDENNHRSRFSLASHVSLGIPCNTQIDENTYERLKILIGK